VSTAEITSLSKRIFTAERPGCIGGRPAPGRGPPGLLFFLAATLALPCFGGGILENGTEAQKQEQYRPQANDVRWKRRSLRTHACLSTVQWLSSECGTLRNTRTSHRRGLTAMTPLQFGIRERMLQAQQLIRETSRSLIEIALEVGYTSTSPSHFAQVLAMPNNSQSDTFSVSFFVVECKT
jgi:AraC-like DNA-binding protein